MEKERLFIAEYFVWDSGSEKYSAKEIAAEVGTDRDAFEAKYLEEFGKKYNSENVTPGNCLPIGLSPTREYSDPEIIKDFKNGTRKAEDIIKLDCEFEVCIPSNSHVVTAKTGGRYYVLGDKAKKLKGYGFWANQEDKGWSSCVFRDEGDHTYLRFWENKKIPFNKRDYANKKDDKQMVEARFMRDIYEYLDKRNVTKNRLGVVRKINANNEVER